MIDILYLSHQYYDWSLSEQHALPWVSNKRTLDSYLKDQDNHVVKSSLEDLKIPIEHFPELISSVNHIHLIDLDLETISKFESQTAYMYLTFLSYLSKIKDQYYQDVKKLFVNDNPRPVSTPCLFVVGCSVSHAVGVSDHERYGSLLSQNLELPAVFLTRPGSSIAWQSDRILQADLKAGDIVVWGLTNFLRVNLADGFDWKGCPVRSYARLPADLRYFDLDYFQSWTMNISCVKSILQVENFCKKIGVKLIIANLMETTLAPLLFKSQSNYVDLFTCHSMENLGQIKWEDVGTDNEHPGPKQHRIFADKIYQTILSLESNSFST